MTEPMNPESGPGWGESLPLPLTPQSSPAAGRADAGQAGQGTLHASARDETSAGSREEGGPKGLEPTRYNDWEQKGRCTDF